MHANILNLADYAVTRIQETEHDYHIYAEVKNGTLRCAGCGNNSIVGHGRNEQAIRDLAMHSKQVSIYVDARRFRSRAYGKTFMESAPF